LDRLLIPARTASTLYCPHVADEEWWTGIAVYNPSPSDCTLTIVPYAAEGYPLPTATRSIAGNGKYAGTVRDLGLSSQTAWFRIDSTNPLSGFALFGAVDWMNRLAAYGGNGMTGGKRGLFPRIEKDGWTGVVLVNTQPREATVTLTAYTDAGSVVNVRTLAISGHGKVVDAAEALFPRGIARATYIAYASDMEILGFQINGSPDGTMVDGLPGP